MVYHKAAMEGVLAAGLVNTDSGDEMKMTENPTMNDASEKIETGFDSRDRRKSKYLSYPYTNEDLRTETSSTMKNASNRTPSYAKLSNKRFRRNWQRKFISSSPDPLHALLV